MDGTFKRGLKIGDTVHMDFELREYSTADLFAAENEVPADKPIQFQAALVARQLVRVGTYTGPFTLALITRLHPVDIGILRRAQGELEKLGEADSPADVPPT